MTTVCSGQLIIWNIVRRRADEARAVWWVKSLGKLKLGGTIVSHVSDCSIGIMMRQSWVYLPVRNGLTTGNSCPLGNKPLKSIHTCLLAVE